MRRSIYSSAALTLALSFYSYAQQNALLPAQEASALFNRSLQLIESTSAAVPGLARAAAPVLENARQSLINIQTGTAGNSGLTYDLLSNVRAYLTLADSMPKPYPFPDEARKQFSELRESVDRMESHFRASLDQRERLLRNPDRDNLKRYAEADERLGKPAPDQRRVVFLGDSITDGWRLNEYFPGRDFVNRGISGQITGEMLGRMKADVIDLKPAAVLILAGTNDIGRGVAVSAIENNLTMIADLAEAYKIKPMFASVLPISDYHKDVNPRFEMSKTRPAATILELNRWIESFCKQRHYTFVDYFSKMVDQAGFMISDLADDGLHPNSAGYRMMGPIALESIDKLVRQRAAPSVPAAAPAPVSKTRVTKTRPAKVATPKTEEAVAVSAPAKSKPKPVAAKEPAPPAAARSTSTETKTAENAKAPPKEKKPSFFKRTYPSTPPPPPASSSSAPPNQ